MRRVTRTSRAAVVVASGLVVTALLGATPAAAASCNLLVDPAGDARISVTPLSSASLDIRSGDVASGATTVVGQLRMSTLTPELTTAAGARWALGFRIGSGTYQFTMMRSATGAYTGGLVVNGVGGPVGFVVDFPNATITWTAPRAAFPDLATPGQTFTDLTATTTTAGSSVDAAWSNVPYVDQSPSCVAAS